MLRRATKGAAYAGRTFSISMYMSSEDVLRMQGGAFALSELLQCAKYDSRDYRRAR